jgi:4-amino-4-deoxy-L-arabinose transferase-like glycosyltransferase
MSTPAGPGPSGEPPLRAADLLRLLAVALGAFFALALGLLLFGDLGAGSLWNSDDALYAQVVREMIASGSATPSPWFDYGLADAYPLGVRYVAAVASIAGVTPFGLRLGAALAALGCLVTLGAAGRTDRRGGFGVVALGIQPIFYLLSQRVLHDALLAFWTTAAVVSYAEARTRDKPALWHALVGVSCAMASLTKVYAGLLPLAVVAGDALVSDRGRWRRADFVLALAGAVVVPSAWYVADGTIDGLVSSLVHRFAGGLEGHGAAAAPDGAPMAAGALGYVLEQGEAGIVLVLLAAAGAVVAARRRDPLDRIALTWALVAATVLGLMQTALVSYALVALVPFALLGGTALAAAVERLPLLAAPALALGLVGLLPLAPIAELAHSADDRVAALGALQAETPPGTLLCTVDVYHAAPTFYAGRSVAYFTEDERSLRILRRTFGEATVPTLAPGDIVRRLDAAEAFACIVPTAAATALAEQLRGPLEVVTPNPTLLGPDVVLLARGLGRRPAAP